MVRNSKLNYTLVILGGLTIATGCNSLSKMTKMAKDQQLKTEPAPLEVHGGEVKFKMTALLPVKMFKKDTKYEVKNFFVNENAEEGKEEFKIEAGSIVFDGNQYYNKKEEQPRAEGNFNFKYEPGKDRGQLVSKGYASKKDKVKETPYFPVPGAKGLILTSLLVRDITDQPYGIGDANEGVAAFEADNYAPEPVKQVFVDFIFEQGSSALRAAEVRDKGAQIDAFVASKNIPETDGSSSINIKGSHSPEGSETVNTNLARQRSNVMEDYYKRQMKKYNYNKEAMTKVKFQVTTQTLDDTKPEFYSLLDANTTLTADQKAEIKQIMDGSGEFPERARQLADKGYYDVLMDEVFPQLRYARTDVYQGSAKTDAEISSLARQIVEGKEKDDKLTESEMLHAAAMTPDPAEKIAIYEAVIKKSDAQVAHHNLGSVQLEMAVKETDETKRNEQLTSAISHFEMSKNRKETAETQYNLGVAYSMQGKKEEAMTAFKRALEMGSTNPVTQRKLNGIKGIMLIKEAKSFDDAKYTEAESAFNEAGNSLKVVYNKALAQLLHRDFDKAMTSIDEAIRIAPNDALSHYVKAIVAARKNDAATMASSLKQAIQYNDSLRARALKDLEFDAFVNSTEFKDAVR